MIVQLTGKVNYQITLDPTVWIFDDRKIEMENAFTDSTDLPEEDSEEALKRASTRWEREVTQQSSKPPVNRSINRFEKEQILKGTYLMPIKDFLKTAEIEAGASQARLVLNNEEKIISLPLLKDSLFLFAENGKPVKENGPVHVYFADGSNRDEPIKGVTKIIIE
ncbi:hypothetical protein ERJ70_08245 [Sediminibacillus dalangtanensis]|uniref:Peptidyl-prolyl cis-trans isomerase n=2 Tax=Sediminibacillus dalangtanensis TaxID=2729421 RepID=A0ABX7VZT2_9BACI|nr:hypothetical protein ERJ70_08245 [Sediminibacillus dalangtanensis]